MELAQGRPGAPSRLCHIDPGVLPPAERCPFTPRSADSGRRYFSDSGELLLDTCWDKPAGLGPWPWPGLLNRPQAVCVYFPALTSGAAARGCTRRRSPPTPRLRLCQCCSSPPRATRLAQQPLLPALQAARQAEAPLGVCGKRDVITSLPALTAQRGWRSPAGLDRNEGYITLEILPAGRKAGPEGEGTWAFPQQSQHLGSWRALLPGPACSAGSDCGPTALPCQGQTGPGHLPHSTSSSSTPSRPPPPFGSTSPTISMTALKLGKNRV